MTAWAVYGGSFDPPHIGHVLVADYILATQNVDRVLMIPTFDHAHGKRLAPFAHRRRMLELATTHLRGVEVSDLEAELRGTSYTVRTLRTLRMRHPDVTLKLVIGSDLVDDVPNWREGATIPELATLCIVGRKGYERDDISVLMPEVSSREVRTRLQEGRSVRGLVPEAVIAHCERFQLYRGES